MNKRNTNNRLNEFLKYYDNQMSVKEKESFEDELSKNRALKIEYNNFLVKFEELRKENQVDENYFNTLIDRSLSNSGNASVPFPLKAAFALPVLILLLFIIIPYVSSENTSTIEEIVELFDRNDEDSSLQGNLIDNDFNYLDYRFDNILLSDIFDDDTVLDESLFDYLDLNISETDINKTFLNQISSNEFEEIYNEILQKQIIGE